jgi:hypothetical protein
MSSFNIKVRKKIQEEVEKKFHFKIGNIFAETGTVNVKKLLSSTRQIS